MILRASLLQKRRAKVDKLASLMCSENFAHYLFIAKGKRLLGKFIPVFNNVCTLILFKCNRFKYFILFSILVSNKTNTWLLHAIYLHNIKK